MAGATSQKRLSFIETYRMSGESFNRRASLPFLKSQVVEGATYICARAIMWFFDLSEALRAAGILLQLTTCSISSAFRCRHIAWVREHDRRALQVRHVVCPDAHRFEKDMNKSSKSKQQTTEST